MKGFAENDRRNVSNTNVTVDEFENEPGQTITITTETI